MVAVVAHARIHIGLADTGFASPRAYGGVGFTIGEPVTQIEVSESIRPILTGFDKLDVQSHSDVRALVDRIRLLPRARPFDVHLTRAPPQHVGYGSKTSLLLSIVLGANTLFGLQLSPTEMQILTRRGRASGIGIHSFFSGGIIWDGGHANADVPELAPSSTAEDRKPAPLMLRLGFPDNWRIALIHPPGVAAAGQVEKAFFNMHLPIDRTAALATMATLYHGVLPAFALRDLNALAAALVSLHMTGFKAIEVDSHGGLPRDLLRELHRQGLCAGMSSMGPLTYVICSTSDQHALALAEEISEQYKAQWLGTTTGWNAGADVSGSPL